MTPTTDPAALSLIEQYQAELNTLRTALKNANDRISKYAKDYRHVESWFEEIQILREEVRKLKGTGTGSAHVHVLRARAILLELIFNPGLNMEAGVKNTLVEIENYLTVQRMTTK